MPNIPNESNRTTSALFDAPGVAQEGPERVQLKRELRRLDYADQLEAVRPPMPAAKVQTLPDSPVQHSGERASSEAVRAAAQSGIQGAASSLPHQSPVQAAFGSHDVSGIKSYSGDKATSANKAMGSKTVKGIGKPL